VLALSDELCLFSVHYTNAKPQVIINGLRLKIGESYLFFQL